MLLQKQPTRIQKMRKVHPRGFRDANNDLGAQRHSKCEIFWAAFRRGLHGARRTASCGLNEIASHGCSSTASATRGVVGRGPSRGKNIVFFVERTEGHIRPTVAASLEVSTHAVARGVAKETERPSTCMHFVHHEHLCASCAKVSLPPTARLRPPWLSSNQLTI